MRTGIVAMCVAVLVCVGAGAAANHFYVNYGWRDKHVLYPARPSGYNAIVSTFGQPCNAASKDKRR